MSYYSRAEQETLYNYDPIDGQWVIYSTYPPDIRKILINSEVLSKSTDEGGRVIEVKAVAERNQVRLFKPRVQTP